ncbi:Peptidase family M23 [Clostridium sp. DSM 8431]|uniref:M23 family metallopeptidase n=1 Tax=Clostridium sp. DSM 8431 TaxID=1761781 RepID=UPI0008E72E47|nr:M23 family metallopeptidase [Clostridium sp. DSM 8431]SFU55686.1 Peptidase family M23 [Clostridium sp. DSM 8431]
MKRLLKAVLLVAFALLMIPTVSAKAAPTITVSGYSQPTNIYKGSVFVLKGTISSTSTITNVNVRVKNNSTGAYEINKSLANSSTSFSLSKIDPYITFNTLSAGSKTFEVRVTSGGVTQTVKSNTFQVVYMSVSGYTAPPATMNKGAVHIIKGKITSSTTITNAGIRIKNNSTGKYEINKNMSNSSSTFDLGKLDNYITFNTLTSGSKTIEVYATSGNITKVVSSSNFTVAGSTNTGLMKWPVPSSNTISSCYMDGRNHYAIDIVASSGAQVISSCAGKVVALNTSCTHNYGKDYSCGCGGGFGNYVVVESTEGGTVKYLRYSHLASVSVKSGKTVSRGTEIGKIGSTGYSGGFHLDFKTYTSGGYSSNTYCVDPTYYVEVPRGINANAATTQCCYDYVSDLKKRLGYN